MVIRAKLKREIISIEDNVVTLVSHAGVPVRDRKGKAYSQEARRRRRCAPDSRSASQGTISISTPKESVFETPALPEARPGLSFYY